MQRICEEKARRIVNWAFMKDCLCEWGQMREWPTGWQRGPLEARNMTQNLQFSAKAQNCHASSSLWPKIVTLDRHFGRRIVTLHRHFGRKL